ncbi:Asp-tRNA(Asn)/Glu-tRNA(Gln) amidotransferase subunit GatC [Alkalibacterium gilvum]|uniref:Asp-tRNA(Asn)/Glu-tRNA(Gln) amidotransferase subunit GatC n=1 Tax=Alkalibacterium gilvum TaxID=1130080 RepID=UPI003F8F894E
MAINEETVKHVAGLAKLEIDEESLKTFTNEIVQMVEMVEQLEELDTDGVEGSYHGHPQINVWRQDKAEKGTDREELFKNVETQKNGFVEVPDMFNKGGSDA